MKLFIVGIYLLTTILSAAFHSEIDAFGADKSKTVVEFSAKTDCCEVNSTHSTQDAECGICHIAHSSLVLVPNSSQNLNDSANRYPVSAERQNLKDFHFVLLRPPIA